jgi:hypothetical protein
MSIEWDVLLLGLSLKLVSWKYHQFLFPFILLRSMSAIYILLLSIPSQKFP